MSDSPSKNSALLESVHCELKRLQLHPANLAASAGQGRTVALRGSLLHYSKLPAIIDGDWFLGVLQALPDVAGPAAVMNALDQAHVSGTPR